MTNNKNMNKKFTFAISSKMFITVILLIVLVTSPLTANLSSIDMAYAEEGQQQQEQIQQQAQHQSQISNINNDRSKSHHEQIKEDNKKKEVFHTLTSISLSSPSPSSLTSLASSNGVKHNIEMAVITLPSGQPAYKMVSHVKSNSLSSPFTVDTSAASVNNNNNDIIDLTSKYSKLATIPGPTLVVSEGDYVKVNIKDKDGNLVTSEEFIASQPGTFLYLDDSKDGENGLYGAVIVNPKNNLTKGLIKGEIQELSLNKLDKDVVLFMVGSTFWGMEIDNKNNYKQIPLWVNPNIGGVVEQKIRFHVLGVGGHHSGNPTDHQHTFHLHAHRWVDPGTNNIIDVKQIIPGKTHSFIIDVGDGVGPGQWQYHCHVFAHMEAGMMGGFKVLSGRSNYKYSK